MGWLLRKPLSHLSDEMDRRCTEYSEKQAGVLTSLACGLTFRGSSIGGPRFLIGLGRVESAVSTAFFSPGDSPVGAMHSHFSEHYGDVRRAVVMTEFRESRIGVLPWLRQRRK